ncbi:MAG: anti-sigma factor [Mycobacteriales bacterium]
MSCPGDLLSGLVDGELDHAARERVLSHLLACPPCSTEVQALRALKTRLSWAGAETPVPSDALTARLLGLVVPGIEPAQRRSPGTVRPVTVRPAGRAGAPGPRSRRVRRRTVGSCLVALGLTTAFVLGGQTPARQNEVKVDPTTDVFVADFADVTTDVPLPEPVDAAVVGISR